VVELSGSCHNRHCGTVNYLQPFQQAVIDTVQQTVAVIQPAADEHVRVFMASLVGDDLTWRN